MIKMFNVFAKFLYLAIMFIIFINGAVGISNVLEYFNITGSTNQFLSYILVIYGIGMFFYDIDKHYNKKDV